MALDEGDKHKAVFGVPSESARTLIQLPIVCRGACFSLTIDEETSGEEEGETTFLAAIFDSIDAESTAEAISHRLAIRLEEPTSTTQCSSPAMDALLGIEPNPNHIPASTLASP